MLTGYTYGKLGETVAAWLLRLTGFKILARRYRTPCGEIDIIAKRGSLLCFIEVKTRSSLGAFFNESCTERQIKRIRRAAEFFINTRRRYADNNMRVDVFFIYKAIFIRRVRNV